MTDYDLELPKSVRLLNVHRNRTDRAVARVRRRFATLAGGAAAPHEEPATRALPEAVHALPSAPAPRGAFGGHPLSLRLPVDDSKLEHADDPARRCHVPRFRLRHEDGDPARPCIGFSSKEAGAGTLVVKLEAYPPEGIASGSRSLLRPYALWLRVCEGSPAREAVALPFQDVQVTEGGLTATLRFSSLRVRDQVCDALQERDAVRVSVEDTLKVVVPAGMDAFRAIADLGSAVLRALELRRAVEVSHGPAAKVNLSTIPPRVRLDASVSCGSTDPHRAPGNLLHHAHALVEAMEGELWSLPSELLSLLTASFEGFDRVKLGSLLARAQRLGKDGAKRRWARALVDNDPMPRIWTGEGPDPSIDAFIEQYVSKLSDAELAPTGLLPVHELADGIVHVVSQILSVAGQFEVREIPVRATLPVTLDAALHGYAFAELRPVDGLIVLELPQDGQITRYFQLADQRNEFRYLPDGLSLKSTSDERRCELRAERRSDGLYAVHYTAVWEVDKARLDRDVGALAKLADGLRPSLKPLRARAMRFYLDVPRADWESQFERQRRRDVTLDFDTDVIDQLALHDADVTQLIHLLCDPQTGGLLGEVEVDVSRQTERIAFSGRVPARDKDGVWRAVFEQVLGAASRKITVKVAPGDLTKQNLAVVFVHFDGGPSVELRAETPSGTVALATSIRDFALGVPSARTYRYRVELIGLDGGKRTVPAPERWLEACANLLRPDLAQSPAT